MKYFLLTILLIATTLPAVTKSRKLPIADVKNLQGKTVSSSTFSNDGKPILINFWATWCKPCVQELNIIADKYPEWKKETGVKIIAISVDDARNFAKVQPFVNGKGWDYEVYVDPNGDFKRVMNVNMVPHSFLLNGKGEIVWQHNSFTPGDEETIHELIMKVAKGETIAE